MYISLVLELGQVRDIVGEFIFTAYLCLFHVMSKSSPTCLFFSEEQTFQCICLKRISRNREASST